MANLPAMQNQYVEFAKNDSNGDKIDIKALNNAIEAAKENPVIPTTLSVNILTSENSEISAQKPVVEVMTGYTFELEPSIEGVVTRNALYAGVCKNGNKLTFTALVSVNPVAASVQLQVCKFGVPLEIYNKIVPFDTGSATIVDAKFITTLPSSIGNASSILAYVTKSGGYINFSVDNRQNVLSNNVNNYFRFELTILLSDNLAATE